MKKDVYNGMAFGSPISAPPYMTPENISPITIAIHAQKACKSFAKCEKRFFQRGSAWTGWENWLTVDVVRRLNSRRAIAFGAYPNSNRKYDILIKDQTPEIAVEIKVTYLTRTEVDKFEANGQAKLSGRLASDAEKLRKRPEQADALLLLAAVFESRDLITRYQKLVAEDLATTYSHLPSHRWFSSCSSDGSVSLLALCSSHSL